MTTPPPTRLSIEDVAVVLGPGVNIKRSPLCGRNFDVYPAMIDALLAARPSDATPG